MKNTNGYAVRNKSLKTTLEQWTMKTHLGLHFMPADSHQMIQVICPTSLLPCFLESAHTVAMIRHSMDVVKKTVEHLNPGQTPVVTLDQPLLALAK